MQMNALNKQAAECAGKHGLLFAGDTVISSQASALSSQRVLLQCDDKMCTYDETKDNGGDVK